MYCVCRITSCYKLLVWLLLLNLGACTKQLSWIRTHLHACEVTIKFTLNICKEINWQSTPICTNAILSLQYSYLCVVALPAQHDWNGADNFIKVFSHELFPTKRVLLWFFIFIFFPLDSCRASMNLCKSNLYAAMQGVSSSWMTLKAKFVWANGLLNIACTCKCRPSP